MHARACAIIAIGIMIAGCRPPPPRLAYTVQLSTLPAPITKTTPAAAINCEGKRGQAIEIEQQAGPFTKIAINRKCRGWIPTAAIDK